jgi:hypothetical protein
MNDALVCKIQPVATFEDMNSVWAKRPFPMRSADGPASGASQYTVVPGPLHNRTRHNGRMFSWAIV